MQETHRCAEKPSAELRSGERFAGRGFHVPLLEENWEAAIETNVFGTLACAAIVGQMLVAAYTANRENGFWSANKGWELNFVLVGVLLQLVSIAVEATRLTMVQVGFGSR